MNRNKYSSMLVVSSVVCGCAFRIRFSSIHGWKCSTVAALSLTATKFQSTRSTASTYCTIRHGQSAYHGRPPARSVLCLKKWVTYLFGFRCPISTISSLSTVTVTYDRRMCL